MDAIDSFFPYPAYRPGQRLMLETAARVARDGGIGLIDAPTGSGKSSVIASLLAERKGRKIIVAVRTISQLATFVREIGLIRRKHNGVRAAYLVGKGSMCRLGGEGDIYRRCEGVKAFSTSLIRERAAKGALDPQKDPFIRQQLRRLDPAHPILCPYFISSRHCVQAETGGIRIVPSPALRTKAEQVLGHPPSPQELGKACGDLCPYELMLHAARGADVIILNYHHLFDRTIREQVYASLGVEPQDLLLLVDEAHNCGDVVTSIESISLEERDLAQASRELLGMRQRHRGADAVRHLLPRLSGFIRGLENSVEAEDWFDPAIFGRMVIRESLYRSLDEIVEDLLALAGSVREKNQKAGEYRETAIERLAEFLLRLSQSATDPAFLTVYRREATGTALEVRSIDPSVTLAEICTTHAAALLISGTLSPVERYARYYFGQVPLTTLSLPNAFPRENRLICGARDVTTAYSMRQSGENSTRIDGYIRAFCGLEGNLAIYFPSYQILETYAARTIPDIMGRTAFVEPRDPQEAAAALSAFLALPASGGCGVLFAVCGGKWSEGLDYRGEMLKGAMVIGLPLAPFNRVRKMMIDYFRHRFGEEGEFLCYTLPAINRSLQALGRVLRTPEDRGVLVLAEKRFLTGGIRAALPAWIREEMAECTAEEFGEVIAAWRS